MRLTPLALLLAAGLAIGGCASTPAVKTADGRPATVLDQWSDKIKVDSTPYEVLLAAHPRGLSAAQTDALTEFVGAWREAEGGLIRVSAPAGAEVTSRAARDFLVSEGVPARQVSLAADGPRPAAGAPVSVSFLSFTVTPPRCGETWENLTATFSNKAYSNFGCAVTANMAAQVANPGDLMKPRNLDPADAGRRQTVLDKYRKGEVTSSVKDDQATGTVAKAVN